MLHFLKSLYSARIYISLLVLLFKKMKIQQKIIQSINALTPVLPGPHTVEVALGLEIYFVVEGDHDQDGQPEGEAGGHDGVGVVHDEPALLGIVVLVPDVLRSCVPSLVT